MVVPPRYFYLLLLLAVCAGFGANDSRRSSSFSFGFYPLSSQKNSFFIRSKTSQKPERSLTFGTSIMLRAGGVQTQMTTTMNKVLSSCVCSSSSSTSSNLMATTTRGGPFATATATRYRHHHHHHQHRAQNGKTKMLSTTGLEQRRTMCTKAASSSNDTNNNKTTTPQEQWKASIDFKAIRENQKHVERNCANRNVAVDVSAGRNLMMTFLRDE